MYFRVSRGIRDNESRLNLEKKMHQIMRTSFFFFFFFFSFFFFFFFFKVHDCYQIQMIRAIAHNTTCSKYVPASSKIICYNDTHWVAQTGIGQHPFFLPSFLFLFPLFSQRTMTLSLFKVNVTMSYVYVVRTCYSRSPHTETVHNQL